MVFQGYYPFYIDRDAGQGKTGKTEQLQPDAVKDAHSHNIKLAESYCKAPAHLYSSDILIKIVSGRFFLKIFKCWQFN